MKVVIAEKPSVAREIATILGATEKKEGFLTGNGFYVTWAFGHLVALGEPEVNGISGFQRESRPMLSNSLFIDSKENQKRQIVRT